jgi:hypothetical protein
MPPLALLSRVKVEKHVENHFVKEASQTPHDATLSGHLHYVLGNYAET